MKKAALLLSGLLLSAFVSGPAAAESVRVRLTARVTQIDDPTGYLAGKVVLGQRVNGLYVYNTNTPNLSPHLGTGQYRPYANEARMRFAIGSQVFESKQPTQGIEILINSYQSDGWFNMQSVDNKPLADGTVIDFVRFELRGQGNVTQSTALPNVAPEFPQYWIREVAIGGTSGGQFFMIRALPEAAELILPDAITVTPASGAFAANQHFDAAVLLPRNSVVASAQATINGVQLFPLSYPGACQLQPQIGTGRPSLLCPAADQLLTQYPPGPIEWTVQMTNGTVYTETVNWERAP